MTRRDLADKLGVERTVIHRVEGGDRDTTVELMRRWAEVLGGISFDLFKPPNRNGPRADDEQRQSAA
jgi:transcriptional regulator with XRE-family HTH domain